ncbi:MAG: helix-hairpin-helix domain-containing protein [Bryobacteraceae bacterium]
MKIVTMRNCSLTAKKIGSLGPLVLGCLATALIADSARAELPPGPGQNLVVQLCGRCHSPELAASQHQSHQQWEGTISKMIGLGAQGTDDQFEIIATYLTKNFGPPPPRPLNVNDATAVELELTFDLVRAEGAAIVQYRTEHGPLKSIDDLKGVPGLDFQKVEAKKARVTF